MNSIPVVSAETFVESEFEERYIYYAQKFGYAGLELETRTPLNEDYFINKANPMITRKFIVQLPHPTQAGQTVDVDREETKPLKEWDPERYKNKVAMADKQYANHERNRQELCNDLMLHLDKSLRAAVTQHPDYKRAKLNNDVIGLWDIVIDSATGKGAHSIYVSMMKFINLRMVGQNSTDYTEYSKKYNDVVADIQRMGNADFILQSLFNAKFVEGLNTTTFADQIKTIMGSVTWPDYRVLHGELMRYVNARKGMQDSLLKKDNPDGIQINAGKINEFKGTCFNCGAYPAGHRAADCPKPKHQCSICGNRGHLDEYCRDNPNKYRPVGRSTNSDRKFPARPAVYRNPQTKFTRTDRKRVNLIKAKRITAEEDENDNDGEDSRFEDEIYNDLDEDDYHEEFYMHSGRNVIEIDDEDKEDEFEEEFQVNRTSQKNSATLFAVDSGCIGGGHVVRDANLLTGLRKANISVQGYDGKTTTVDSVGHIPGIGKAVVVETAPNNLLNLRKLCKDIQGNFKGDHDHMEIFDKNGNLFAEAKDHGDGFLSVEYKPTSPDLINAGTVRNVSAEHFTAEEHTRATEAYALCGKLGHPGFKGLQKSLDEGAYPQTHLTSQDVRNAKTIFGPCLACLEGKMKKPKEISSKTPPATKIGERIYVDLIPYDCKRVAAVGGFVGSVFAVDEKSGYVIICGIKTKSEVLDALQTITTVFNSHRHQVGQIVSDDESSFTAHIVALSKWGIKLTSTPAGQHNKRVERYIQTFKKRRESILASLAYRLPEGKLEHELALATVRGMNSSCNTASGSRSPYELFTGKKAAIPKHVFGQPGICYNPNPVKKGAHGQWCIFLGHRDNEHYHNMRVFVPTTGTVCSRMRFEPTNTYPAEWGFLPRLQPSTTPRGRPTSQPLPPLPPPQPERSWQRMANAPADANTIIQTGTPLPAPDAAILDASTSSPVLPHLPYLNAVLSAPPQHSEGAPPRLPAPTSVSLSSRQEGDHPVTGISAVTPPQQPPPAPPSPDPIPPPSVSALPLPSSTPSDTRPPAQPKTPTRSKARGKPPEGEPVLAAPPREYNVDRPRRQAALNKDYASLHSGRHKANAVSVRTMNPTLTVYRLSLTRALTDAIRIKDTLNAARKEITHLFETLEALRPVNASALSKEEKGCIINGHLFFKDQYLADGSFKGRKARLVMNGNEEHPNNMDETRSPTVNPISLFSSLAVSANSLETTHHAYDVVSAFPTTAMPKNKTIIVRIRKGKLVDIFLQTYPELKKNIEQDGCLYFRLTKFLYGLAEAARAFYDRMSQVLKEIGFKKSEVDEGLFTMDFHHNGTISKHIVCVHVDDIFSISPSPLSTRKLENGLRKYFEIKEQHGSSISYLGMLILKDTRTGHVQVNQSGFIKELLEKFKHEVAGKTATTPSPAEFSRPKNTVEEYKDKSRYLSIVMSLMYLARLTRPDILMSVAYLATKSQNPDISDYKNICQVLRYISATKTMALNFQRSTLEVKLAADASHILHHDGRGHSGIVITIGGTAVIVRSTKQRVQARSSTEAEIIAAEECATYIPFLISLCKELSIPLSTPLTLGQDNKSAICSMQQGGQFNRTKHMLARIAYLKSMIDSGFLSMTYIPTGNMVADIMTKPLSSKLHARHRTTLGLFS